MNSQNRYLLLAVLSVLAMIVLLFSVKISPAIARDNNPFSGARSIAVTMTRVVHHRHHRIRPARDLSMIDRVTFSARLPGQWEKARWYSYSVRAAARTPEQRYIRAIYAPSHIPSRY